jgi:hypothetical protein
MTGRDAGNEATSACTDNICWGSLGFHRGQDPLLYDLYARKLLIRGWAGRYTDEEEEFRKDLKPPSEAMKEKGRRLASRQTTNS